MGVVLGESAYAGHAVELTGLFPAVDGAEFGESYGKVTIGVWLGVENLDVHGAVHRLEEVAFDFAFFHAVGEVGAGAAFGDEFCEAVAVDDWRVL